MQCAAWFRYRDVITKLCAPDAQILLETVVYDPCKYGGNVDFYMNFQNNYGTFSALLD